MPLSILYRQLIYNYPEQLFADAGVMAIEHADFDGIERLALFTEARSRPLSITQSWLKSKSVISLKR